MKKLSAKLALALIFTAALVACTEEMTYPVPSTLMGLWGKDSEISDNSVVPFIEINETGATYCRAIPDLYDFSDRTPISITFNAHSGKGQITIQGGKSEEFVFDATGCIVTASGDVFYPIESSLDLLACSKGDILMPSNDPDLVGPSEYHDLSLNSSSTASLSSNLYLQSTFMDLLKWLSYNIAQGMATGTGSKTVQELYDMIFKSEEGKVMDQVLSTVGEINDKLNELIELYHNTTYEKYLNDRINTYLSPMNNYNSLYIKMLEDCDGSETAIMDIATKWATTSTISGNSPTVQFLNFIDFLRLSIVEQKNMYQIYDTYVFNTHAWECEGYEIREALRTSDLAVIAGSAYLAMMYARCRTDISETVRESLLNDINNAVQSYKSYSEANMIERHDNMAICQISGAHFKMNISLEERDYYSKPWFPNRTLWENEDSIPRFLYGSTNSTPSALKGQLFTNSDITKMFNYYKGSKYANFWEVLTKAAKCSYPFDSSYANFKQIFFLTQDGGYYTRDDGTIFRFGANNAIVAKDGFKRANTDIGKGELETVGFFCKDRVFAGWTNYNSGYLWVIPHIVSRY